MDTKDNTPTQIDPIHKLSRRRFFQWIFLGAAALTGCEPNAIEPTSIPNIVKWYPELKTLSTKQNGEISTAGGTIEWYNFSDLNFNVEAAKQALDGYQGYVQPQPKTYYQMPDGTTLELNQYPLKNRIQKQIIILVPHDAPDPSWAHGYSLGATTNRTDELLPTVSFVRVFKSIDELPEPLKSNPPTSLVAYNNRALLVEMCQANIGTTVISNNQPDLSLSIFGQELSCNSYGSEIEEVMRGNDPKVVMEWAKTKGIFSPQGVRYPLVLPDPSFWQHTPQSGGILSSK